MQTGSDAARNLVRHGGVYVVYDDAYAHEKLLRDGAEEKTEQVLQQEQEALTLMLRKRIVSRALHLMLGLSIVYGSMRTTSQRHAQ